MPDFRPLVILAIIGLLAIAGSVLVGLFYLLRYAVLSF